MRNFLAEVGLDDEIGDPPPYSFSGIVGFEVWADSSLVASSGTMYPDTAPYSFDVEISGVSVLNLVVTDPNGTNNADHADWGDARVDCGTWGGNQAPVAVDDVASTTQDNSVVVAVLTNDSDPDQDPLHVSDRTDGTTTTNGTTVTYTPDSGYTGQDTFTYTASDGDVTDIWSAPHRRFPRRGSTRRRSCRDARFGDRCGRDDRSHKPDSLSVRNRSRYIRTVLASTWNRSAVASMVQPRSRTQATIRRRPSGVSGALGCWDLA